MSVMKLLGTMLQSIRGPSQAELDKATIIATIDSTRGMVDTALEAVNSSTVTGELSAELQSKSDNPHQIEVTKIYRAYVSKLVSRLAHQETNNPLVTVGELLTAYGRDLDDISAEFTKVFDGVDATSLTPETTRLYQAALLGYIDQISDHCEWVFYLTYLLALPKDVRVPGYILNSLHDRTESIAHAATEVGTRLGTHSIIEEVERMRKHGGDTFLMTAGHTADNFVSDSDLSETATNGMRGFINRNWFKAVGNMFIRRERMKYERNLKLREWLQTKIAVMQLEHDKDSPDAKRQEEILHRYTDILADYERKIKEYEH